MPPIHLLIKPASSLCNMRCAYCFYADVSQQRDVPSYGMMSVQTLEVLVQKALAYAEGDCTFAFQGGEPTLAGLDFFRALIDFQRRYNTRRVTIHNAIQTNGLLMDAQWAAFFREHGFLVGLSMDGDAAIHNALRPDGREKGTYNRVARAADVMRGQGCDYNILCVVTREVARHGARVYNHLRRHQYLQFIPCIDDFDGHRGPYAIGAADYEQFLKATFDRYYHDFTQGMYVSVRTFDNYIRLLMGQPPENCAMHGVCTCNLVVEGDGSLYPCDFYVLDRWRLGNIHTQALAEMLQGERAAAFIEASVAVAAPCRGCQWYPLCRGGCRRDRDLRPGEGLSLNRFCEAYRGFFAYSIDRMQEMARQIVRANGGMYGPKM